MCEKDLKPGDPFLKYACMSMVLMRTRVSFASHFTCPMRACMMSVVFAVGAA